MRKKNFIAMTLLTTLLPVTFAKKFEVKQCGYACERRRQVC